MKQYILALDQGTTGTTALLIGEDLEIAYENSHDFPQYFPRPGWVEHNLEEIWGSVLEAVTGLLKKSQVDPKAIVGIGITNQRETTSVWVKEGKGLPVGPAIVWQDRRTHEVCEKLKKRNLEKVIQKKTGLCLDPYFSGTKLQWILCNTPNLKTPLAQGKLAFGTIDSFVLYRLTGEHKTDASNASRTLLMNLQKVEWDEDLLKLFKIPKNILPTIQENSSIFGHTKNFPPLPDGIPVASLCGDQQAALFGQACFSPGEGKCTYGTGAFALLNCGEKPFFSKHKLLTSVAWKIRGKTTYCLEGSSFIAGAAVQWFRDSLGVIKSSAEIESLADQVESSEGALFVPALSGLSAPYWNAKATGLLTGITRGTTKAHVAKALLEGVAFQVGDLIGALEKDINKKIKKIIVDGGASENKYLMQFQSDIIQRAIVKTNITESTAFGAGLQAGLGIGFWDSLENIQAKIKSIKTYEPKISLKERNRKMVRWQNAIKAVQILSQSS